MSACEWKIHMAGWNLKMGAITSAMVSDEKIWSLFNFVFSDSSRKRNTYKFGFIKALLDNLFNGEETDSGFFITYKDIFGKFAENYWNLVIKYDLRQMRYDGKSMFSKIETILKQTALENECFLNIEYDSLSDKSKCVIVNKVTRECKKYVVGALYEDFEGIIYSFDLNGEGIFLNYCVYEFMLRHKTELERLNYYAWAKFLEGVNDDNALVRVIDKLEVSTPRRNNLSIYRELLRKEFGEDTCFYCGKKLSSNIHVDHFIPWSFVKDDKAWNFVLSCSRCNERKNNKVPCQSYLIKIENRNKMIKSVKNEIILHDFESYSDTLMNSMWRYAKMSGLKEYLGIYDE